METAKFHVHIDVKLIIRTWWNAGNRTSNWISLRMYNTEKEKFYEG